MRGHPHWGRAGPILGALLPGGVAIHPVRHRGHLLVSVGFGVSWAGMVRFCRDGALHYNFVVRLYLPLEEGRTGVDSLGLPRIHLGETAVATRGATSFRMSLIAGT